VPPGQIIVLRRDLAPEFLPVLAPASSRRIDRTA